jgi:tetratricopeptide (TPR) repeat protein
LNKKHLYIFLFAVLHINFLISQDAAIPQLVNSVLIEKTFEKQQDRHIRINDSLDNLTQYKKEFAYLKAIENRSKAEGIKKLEATVLISLGNFYIGTGNYTTALEIFTRSLKTYEELGDFSGQSTVHANMGNAYFYLHDLEKALYYYKIAVSDLKKAPDKANKESRLANCYNNLGSIYCSKGDFVFGRTYFNLAYQIWGKSGDSLSIAYILNNYANIYYEQKKMDSAFFYFNKALGLKVRYGDGYDKADAFNNLGDYYVKNEMLQKGIEMARKAITFLDTTIYSRQLMNSYHILTEGYNDLKDYRNELRYYKKYKAASDSSDLQGQKSDLGRKEMKMEFDRIHLSDSIKAVEEIKIKDLKLSEKKQQSYLLIFILILTVVALSSIYSRFKITKKQKLIIERKNKEITDSINYAKKIQQSIQPSEKFIEKEITRLKDKD